MLALFSQTIVYITAFICQKCLEACFTQNSSLVKLGFLPSTRSDSRIIYKTPAACEIQIAILTSNYYQNNIYIRLLQWTHHKSAYLANVNNDGEEIKEEDKDKIIKI